MLTHNKQIQHESQMNSSEDEYYIRNDNLSKITVQRESLDQIERDLTFASKLQQKLDMPQSARNIAKAYLEINKNPGENALDLSKVPSVLRLPLNKTRNPESSSNGIGESKSSTSIPKFQVEGSGNVDKKKYSKINSIFKQQKTQVNDNESIGRKDQVGSKMSVKFDPPQVSQTSYNPQGMAGFSNQSLQKKITSNNLGSISSNQINKNSSQSQLPGIYKEYLPAFIKNQLQDQTSTTMNFNPSLLTQYDQQQKKMLSKYGKKDLQVREGQDIQQIQAKQALKSDISFLKESLSKSRLQNQEQQKTQNLPTILTTGEKAQDDLLITTLGMKNLGMSLIDLPQTMEDLIALLRQYSDQFEKAVKKVEEEEIFYESYLKEQFKAIDLLHNNQQPSSVYSKRNQTEGGQTLKDFAKSYLNKGSSITNRLLSSEKKKSRKLHFNINEKKSIQELQQMDQQPPLVSTRPEKLSLINNKVLSKHKNDVFKYKKGIGNQQEDQVLNEIKGMIEQTHRKDKQNSLQNRARELQEQNDSILFGFIQDISQGRKNSIGDSPVNLKQSPNQLRLQQVSPMQQKFQQQSVTNNNNNTNKLSQQLAQLAQGSSLGNPSSRQDAILLMAWLEKMLFIIQNEISSQKEFQLTEVRFKDSLKDIKKISQYGQILMFPMIQLVFNIAVKEVCRQVSVQCIERGIVIKKIFQGYMDLIEMLNLDYKFKKKKIKREYAEKLDKYISNFDSQIKYYKEQVMELERNAEQAKLDIEDYQQKIGQQNMIILKLKKKAFVAQKDAEQYLKKSRFLEKENAELRSKLQDLIDKYGDDVSTLDEVEQRKLMEQVEKEYEREQEKEYGEVTDNMIAEMPEKDIIKEEDRATDMGGFKNYLVMTFGEKFFTVETQTDKIFRKHVKIGVNPGKIGILRDKETFTDPKIVGVAVGGDTDINDQAALQTLTQQYLSEVIEEDNENEEDEDGQETESEGLNYDEIDEFLFAKPGFKLTYDKLKRRSNSFSYSRSLRSDKNEDQQIDQNHRIIGGIDLLDSDIKMDLKNSFKKKRRNSANNIRKGVFSLNTSFYNKDMQRKNKKHKQITLYDLIGQRVQKRLKGLVNSKILEQTLQQLPDFYEKVVSEIVNSKKDVKTLNEEISSKTKLARQQSKLNKINSLKLKQSTQKADNLELDNYVMKEALGTLVKLNDEQKQIVQGLLQVLDKEQNMQKLSSEVRKQLVSLQGKLNSTKKRTNLDFLKGDLLFSPEGQFQDEVNETNNLRQNSSITVTQTENNRNELKLEDDDNDNITDFGGESKQGETGEDEINNLRNKLKNKIDNSQTRKKALTRFQLFNLGVKKSMALRKQGPHPCYKMLKNLQGKDKKNIKDMMPKKMLLRVIYQIYQEKPYFEQVPNRTGGFERGNTITEGNSASIGQQQQQNLIEFVYDNFMHKYGLKNVAEKKFSQVIATCILYGNSVPRIRLFGRFMEVYNELPVSDYNKYNEMLDLFMQQILNFKIEDDEEIVLIPFNRAFEHFKVKFESKLTPSALSSRLQKLERMKISVNLDLQKQYKHLKGVKEALDFDQFAEFIIDNLNYLIEERIQQIKDVYLAVDLNNDGLMSLQEFQLLMKVFHYRSAKEIWRLFEEYGESGVDEQNPYLKYISLEQFTQMSMDKDFFNPKIQLNFIQTKNMEQDFKLVGENLEKIASTFKQRLVFIEMHEDLEYLELIDNFKNCIKYPFSIRVGWLTFRIVDEILKRLFVKKVSDRMIPLDMKSLGLKMKPSASVLALAPLNFYDTL